MKNKSLQKFIFVFLFVLSGTILNWLLYQKPLIGIDDANIYFVYMRNFANGNGFVYNAGGEHVEGFTSLLWTLTGSLVFRFSSQPEITLLILNVLIVSFTLWQLILFTGKFFADQRILFSCTIFILASLILVPGYFDWAILALLETGLWSCLLILTIITLCRFEFENENHSRNNFLFSMLLALLLLCRPESYLWGAVFLFIRYLQLKRISHRGKNFSLSSFILPAAVFVAAVAGITACRIFYFGFPFPNTYYAKVSSNHLSNLINGIKYDIHFAMDFSFLSLVLLCSAVFIIHKFKNHSSDIKFHISQIIFFSILITLLIPLYTGGDHFRLARFIQPVVPLFYFLFVLIITDYFKKQITIITSPTAVTAALILVFLSPASGLIRYLTSKAPEQEDFILAQEGRKLGSRMSDFFDMCNPLPSNGITVAGGEAFSYKGVSVDLLGLNSVYIAHAERNKEGPKDHASLNRDCVLNLAPDFFTTASFVDDTSNFVILERNSMYQREWFQQVFKGIFADEKFRKAYLPVYIFRRGDKNIFHAYAHRNFLTRLDTNYYSYKIIPR